MKILIVFGTRPEAIKMAPVVHACRSHPEIQTTVCVTAQHRQMLDQVMNIFDIQADIDLDLMRSGQDLYDVTSAVMLGMRDVIAKTQPDIVLVHGDTTTAFATATAAFYAGVPIGHVEAGLRTYDIQAPFPEEFNRQVISKIARLHFAPTESSKNNLVAEGVAEKSIFTTGNTVIDALFWVLDRIKRDAHREDAIANFLHKQLAFDWRSERFVLITGHRRENFGDGFLAICDAIKQLAVLYPDTHFIYPVHLNPNVQAPVYQLLKNHQNIHLIAPLEYEPFVYLLQHSYLVLTDSGGIQEEAPSLGKPVLVMRSLTERPEAVTAGTVRLVGADTNKIVAEVSNLLSDQASYEVMSKAHNPYGDGVAARKIVGALLARE